MSKFCSVIYLSIFNMKKGNVKNNGSKNRQIDKIVFS